MPNNVFPYPGNKARHSEWIIQHIPEHTCYVEPFGGAAGVLFNKPKSKVEVYNDLNDDIVHFFRVLRGEPDELKEWLSRVPFSRKLYDEWADEYYAGCREDDGVERAGRFFFLRYSQFGGKIDGKAGFKAPTWDNEARKYRNKAQSLSEFSERLESVTFESDDCLKILERYDDPNTVFYLDPPYQGTEGKYNSQGFDHYELYQEVSEIDGRCLISYDSLPHFYGDGFHVDTKASTFQIDNTQTDGHKDATECLIMNFDSEGEPLMSDVGQQGLDAFGD